MLKTKNIHLSVHLCGRGVHSLPLNSLLGHISHALSVATGRIPSLFCAGRNEIALRCFRFKDMIRTIYDCVRTKQLPLHFDPDINYLSDKDPSKLREIENYLRGVINKNKYVELLKSVP